MQKEFSHRRQSFVGPGFVPALLGLALFCLTATPALAKRAKLAQNISPLVAYDMVQKDPGIYLIDVRTPEEYQFIGHAPMAYNIPFMYLSHKFVEKGQLFRGKTMKKTRYQPYLNPDFMSYMKAHFKPGDTLLIMCRSGHRSVPASDLLVKNGFKKVYNVVGGFEGNKFHGRDKEERKLLKKYSENFGRRGIFDGWKHYGLPWTYKMDPKYIYEPHKK
jgi:rhodanese-related sulfurtransferase